MLNNKGQVLVVFVILLPIFLIILTGLVDLCILNLEVKKLNTNTHDAMQYYLDNLDNENVLDDTKTLLNKNLKDINIEIYDNSNLITIKVIKDYRSVYSVFKNDNKITSIYTGNKQSKKIKKG